MGKASRKKKLIHEGCEDQGQVKSSKTFSSPQIEKELQKPSLRTKLLLMIFIILLSSFAVYFNSLSNGFVYDDDYQVLENRWITDVGRIPDIFSKSVWSFQSASSTSNYYRPVMHLVYMFNYHIFGLKPWGFHLVNILFHAGVSIMVFFITLRVLKELSFASSFPSLIPPFVAALLFATHPIHTEAVTWVAGVTDLSFTLFYLLSFYFYLWSTDNNPPLKGIYALSVASFFVGTLCKETALTLPLILVAYDYTFKRGEFQFTSSLKRYLPYLIVAGIYFILRFHALGQFAPQKRHPDLSTYQYLINIFPLFIQYLEKLILPLNLNAFHVLHPISSLSEAKGVLSLIITIAFGILIFVAFRKNKVLFLGLLFITVPLLPVLYIPVLGENTFAERYLYVSSFGFVLVLASFMNWTKANRPKAFTVLTLIFIAIAGLYTLQTVSRNTIWKDDYGLFTDMVKKSPDAKEPHNDLGAVLMDNGRIDEAIEQFRISSTLNPDFAEARGNLGAAFLKKGLIDKAIEQCEIAVRLNPNHASAHNNLGAAFYSKGWIDKAIAQYQIVLKLNPNDPNAHNNLGLAFFYYKGWIDKAIDEYQTAVRLSPSNPEFRKNLAKAYEVKKLNRTN